jgi:transcriptional regulator of arginine metabolism
MAHNSGLTRDAAVNTQQTPMNIDSNNPQARGDFDAVARRQAVRELVARGIVGSQAELGRLLANMGFQTTQATLSRDLKALRIGKVPAEGQGYVYVLPQTSTAPAARSIQPVELGSFVLDVRPVGALVLVRTPVGSAQTVGKALDALGWSEIEGTVSGEDTVLVVVNPSIGAEAFCTKFRETIGQGA